MNLEKEFIKETNKNMEGGCDMCKAFEELAEKRVLEEKMDLAKKFLANGKLSVEEVAECMGLPVNVVEELVDSK